MAVIVGAMIALVSPGTALAASFTVDSTDGLGDFNPGDGQCNAKPPTESPICTLNAALQEANAQGSPATITLPGGAIQMLDPSDPTGDSAESFAVPVTIVGAGEGATIINGSIVSGGGGAFLTMSDVTVNGDVGLPAVAGAMNLNRVTLSGHDFGAAVGGSARSTLDRVTVKNTGAGGISGNNVMITDTTVTNSRGTGIGVSNAELFFVTVRECLDGISLSQGRISVFESSGNQGLGLFLSDVSHAVDGKVLNNQVGGVFARNSEVTDIEVSQNSTTRPGGVGGIELTGTSKLALAHISNNRGAVGGLQINGGTTTLDVVSIDENRGTAIGGLSIMGGSLTGNVHVTNNTSDADAGGINNFEGRVALDTATVTGNSAAELGGGIINRGRVAVMSLTNSSIKSNVANHGGGLVNIDGSTTLTNTGVDANELRDPNNVGAGILMGGGTLVVDGSKISNNKGSGVTTLGGTVTFGNVEMLTNEGIGFHVASSAILASSRSEVTVTRGNIRQNRGGGVATRGASGSRMEIINSIIRENQRPPAAANAGGITNGANNTLQLTDATVEGNQGSTGGIENAGVATLTRVTIASNTGTVGGFQQTATANVSTTLSAVTISGNTGSGGPGGLQALTQIGLTGVTIASNTGLGLVTNTNAARLRSTLIASNSGGDCQGAPASLGHNLSSDATCTLNATLGDLIGVNPLLNPLGGPSGQPQTHALAPNSPAIDAGDNAECARTPLDGNGDGTAICDIGAFEAPAVAAPSCSPRSNKVVVTAVPNGDGRLKATVTAGVGNIQKIEFGAATNALVLPPGAASGTAGNFTFTPPTPVATVTFLVSRPTAGQGSTVQLTVHDTCGPWPTFVGGGAQAF